MAEQPTSSSFNMRMARFDAWQKLSLDMIKRCVISAFLIGVGLFILFALLSYSPNDPSWAQVSSDNTAITNLMGASGAWFAGVFFAFLGYAAWLVPLFFLYELVNLWWFKYSTPRILRYPAVIFALLSLSASLTLSLPDFSRISDIVAGGILGVELGQSVSLVTGKWLGLFFTTVLFFLAFSYGFQVRWLNMWRSRHRLFEPRVLDADDLSQQHVSYENDLTMQPTRTEAKTKANMKAAVSQTLKTPLFTRRSREKSNDHSRETAPESASTFVEEAQQDTLSVNRGAGFAAEETESASLHTATTEALPTQPIPSRPITQTEGVSRGEKAFDELAEEVPVATQSHAFSNVADTRIEPVFDDLLELTKPVAMESQQTESEPQPAPVKVLETLSELSDKRSDLPHVYGGSHTQDTLAQASKPESSRLATHELSISEKAQATKAESISTQGVTREPNSEHVCDEEVLRSGIDHQRLTDDIDDLPRFKPTTSSKLGNPSNPNGDKQLNDMSSEDDEQMDLLQESAGLVSAPSFAAAAMAVTEGETPEDIFDELEAQMSALSDEAVEETEQVNGDSTYSQDINHASQRVETETVKNLDIASVKAPSDEVSTESVVEKPLQPDYFSETTGSRAFAKAAHRANLSPVPSIELLEKPDPNQKPSYSQAELARLSELLEIKLNEFNIKATVVSAQPGPVVTQFEVDLAPGVKASKVTNISRDLARSLSMASVRVVEVIPGKPYIGIEVPNHKREMVRLYELLTTKDYQNPKAGLSMALGKDIAGRPVVTDLAKAPHMLVAGTTGSGKSVAVNAMLLSLLLKYTPEQLRLILIDPKQLELANYNDIPHLLTEVVTDMKDAASALNWCVMEMERRYKLMAFLKVRKLADFNKKIVEAEKRGEDFLDPLWRPNDDVSTDKPPRLKQIPLVVVVADEFADMIMQVGKQAEELITRLAQKSRAAGIHLILATQRPSVDVITGLIKANIPTRVALRVNSKVDSRTILDSGGAEDMLGNGDMLFLGPGKIEPERAHGAFISDDEVNTICDAWRERGSPDYVEDMMSTFDIDGASSSGGSSEGKTIKTGETDAFYDDAVAFVMETRKVSASSIQRKFSIGYNRAARIVDAMEAAGLVSSMGKSGKREILM